MASAGTPVPILGPDLRVLFVGINPSLRSAAVGHNFARPGNRFWPTLHAAGFTPHRLAPDEDRELPRYGVGLTNLSFRPTRAAAELTRDELRAGAAELERVVREWQPPTRTTSPQTSRASTPTCAPTRTRFPDAGRARSAAC